jgi:anti-sigma factor RsiW
MEHEQAQSKLSEYLEGCLSAERAQELEEHLAGCPECTADLELLKRALNLVHQMPPVEAPPDFSSQVKRRARKAGLFAARRRRAATRQLVPIEAVMAVLLAAMGAFVIFLLVFYSELQSVVVEHRPVAILVRTNPEVNLLAQAAWHVDGEVWTIGKQVPKGERLGASPELELILPPTSWPKFLEKLGSGTATLPREPPSPGSDGKIHVIVQRTEVHR